MWCERRICIDMFFGVPYGSKPAGCIVSVGSPSDDYKMLALWCAVAHSLRFVITVLGFHCNRIIRSLSSLFLRTLPLSASLYGNVYSHLYWKFYWNLHWNPYSNLYSDRYWNQSDGKRILVTSVGGVWHRMSRNKMNQLWHQDVFRKIVLESKSFWNKPLSDRFVASCPSLCNYTLYHLNHYRRTIDKENESTLRDLWRSPTDESILLLLLLLLSRVARQCVVNCQRSDCLSIFGQVHIKFLYASSIEIPKSPRIAIAYEARRISVHGQCGGDGEWFQFEA